MMYGMHSMGWGWGFQLIIIIAMLAIFWWLLKSQGLGNKESPEEIVKRRYASGEISKKEYNSLLEDLKKG